MWLLCVWKVKVLCLFIKLQCFNLSSFLLQVIGEFDGTVGQSGASSGWFEMFRAMCWIYVLMIDTFRWVGEQFEHAFYNTNLTHLTSNLLETGGECYTKCEFYTYQFSKTVGEIEGAEMNVFISIWILRMQIYWRLGMNNVYVNVNFIYRYTMYDVVNIRTVRCYNSDSPALKPNARKIINFFAKNLNFMT